MGDAVSDSKLVMASLFKNNVSTSGRIRNFVAVKGLWRKESFVNQVYSVSLKVNLTHYSAPVPNPNSSLYRRISFQEAKGQTFVPAKVGDTFGPSWATHWFKIEAEVPEAWNGSEVHLRWDSECEGTLYSENGDVLQGLSGNGNNDQSRLYYIITKAANKNKVSLYLEMACNGMFGTPDEDQISPPNMNRIFKLKIAEIAVYNRVVQSLITDINLLADIASKLSAQNPRALQALYTANQMVNTIKVGNQSTYAAAQKVADAFFAQKNGDSQHTLVSIGNCHIDSAWLWPYDESVRKCARSFSSAIKLMEDYPEYVFVASQVQQHLWMKESYPNLFARMKEYCGKGQFIPVGGTWVEMDGLMPSGESFIRQFLYGQRFYKSEYNMKATEFWLPDTFGYSAQLPQIAQHCGISRFLTQKISWNLVNKFPHHNFHWQGIDGSSLLTHFPPGDSYGMHVEIDEILRTVTNLRDKGRVSRSVFLYGYGDGGGGPTEEMILRQRRLADVDGIPKIVPSKPTDFFKHIEDNEIQNVQRWVGELFLELHNATYTTQAAIKMNTRKREFDMHDAEFLATVAAALANDISLYPRDALLPIWHKLLLNQFHDVLPGTTIHDAVKQAEQYFEDVKKFALKLRDDSVKALLSAVSRRQKSTDNIVVVNTLGWQRVQMVNYDNGVYYADVPSMGYLIVKDNPPTPPPVKVEQQGDSSYLLSNEIFKAIVDSTGRVVSFRLTAEPDREAVADKLLGNQFVIFDDYPLYWDAWDVMDYHLETRSPITQVLQQANIVKISLFEGGVNVVLEVSDKSSVDVTVLVQAGCPYLIFKLVVNWNETHKFLKVEFPVNVLTTESTYEIQMGHLKRPNHYNTSWDSTKYEVCGHKWCDMSEHNFGVALLNDCKYGYSNHANVIRLSLLRSPKHPDDQADVNKKHDITYAFMPHIGSFQAAGVVQRAYELNNPLKVYYKPSSEFFHSDSDDNSFVEIVSNGLVTDERKSWFSVDQPSVILETVKFAEDSKSVLLRLYEAHGGRCTATVTTALSVKSVALCNGLEEVASAEVPWTAEGMSYAFTPFKIISLLLHLN